MKRLLCGVGLLCLVGMPVQAQSPVEQARQRSIDTFAQAGGARIPVDRELINGEWTPVPFDQAPYTFTFEEIRENWDDLMSGLRIPYPSPEWLKMRFERFPGLMHELGYQDRDWQMHSLNILEGWQAFFRGDYRKAYELGKRYGGYAEVPGVFSQILYGVYLADTLSEKQMHLQDALDRIQHYGRNFPYLPGEERFHADYVMMRLGLAYAFGRLTEDAPLAEAMANGYAITTINAATEALAVMPDHALILALNAAFDGNVIRRVGKTAGRMALGAKPINAVELFNRALAVEGDMAILRYEYGNTLLYVDEPDAMERAIKQFETAIEIQPDFAMEALDRLYAKKRLAEVRAWQGSGMDFSAFDRKRRAHMNRTDDNLYSVLHDPFIVEQ
jgi:tetratricopeptide (TPR) repeat protein